MLEEISIPKMDAIRNGPFLTERERHQQFVEWNRTQADYPNEACFQHLFEDQVERTPDAIAVEFEDQKLSYRELNQKANALAHRLHALGVGPDLLVAICIEPSLEMLVGLLGILKAGGAYVPLDPTYPKDRLAFMLEDSEACLLLTQSWLQDSLPVGHRTRVVYLDKSLSTSGQDPDKGPKSGVQANHLAYVIYTSGSTGRPKGAMIVHRGLVNYLTWCTQTYHVADGGGAPVFSSISFDLTITGLFAPLLVGRTVYLLRQGPGSEAFLAAWRRMKNMSLIKITPAHLQLLTSQLEPHEAADRVKTFVIGGENLSAESVAFWREFAPETTLINEYGPTETVVGCCVYQIPKDAPRVGAVPIGRPIANTQLYILDEHRQPMPVGDVGELYIGGDGVAQGYLYQPELTRERFIPDPFSRESSRRLYKTGDLARYRADGNIEFVGRIDDQVKVRGYRIELGEIEAVLRSHPAVLDAAVIAKGDSGANKRLAAYLVLHPNHLLTIEETRLFLQHSLPEHMVPSAFVFLDALPLTVNGKVDRRSLPPLCRENFPLNRQTDVPRDSLELQLVTMIEEVLDVHSIGIRDDFFLLGGNSLLAAQFFMRIAKRFKKSLPLSILLQAPTVEKLAPLIRAEGWTPNWTSFVPIQPEGARPALYCVHPVGGNILAYRDLGRCLGPDQPVYGIQPQGLDGKGQPYRHVKEMAAHYVADLRRLQPDGPYCLGGLSFGGIVALEMAQQLRAAGQAVKVLALFDTAAPGYFKSIVTRLPAHLRLFLSLGSKGKLTYLSTVIAALGVRIHRAVWQLCSSLYYLGGFPLPSCLMNMTFINEAAERNYVPKPYPGRIVLFRAKEQFIGTCSDPLLGWGPYVVDGIDVHEIAGSHVEIVEWPNVRILTGILKNYLEHDSSSANLMPD